MRRSVWFIKMNRETMHKNVVIHIVFIVSNLLGYFFKHIHKVLLNSVLFRPGLRKMIRYIFCSFIRLFLFFQFTPIVHIKRIICDTVSHSVSDLYHIMTERFLLFIASAISFTSIFERFKIIQIFFSIRSGLSVIIFQDRLSEKIIKVCPIITTIINHDVSSAQRCFSR